MPNNARILALEVMFNINNGGNTAAMRDAAQTVLSETQSPSTREVGTFVESGDCFADLLSALAVRRKIPAIKAVRTLFNLGLRDAKIVVEVMLGEYDNASGTLQNALAPVRY